MKTSLLPVLLVLLCLPLTAAAGEGQPADVIVSAGEVTVSRDELLDLLVRERKSGDLLRYAGASSEEGIERIARDLLETKLMARAARERGVAAVPEVSRQLTRSSDAILAEALLRQTLAAVDTGSDAARRFYDGHPDLFRTAPRRKARHIVVAGREEADRIADDLRGGADFASLASARNSDATRSRGGDLGWVSRGVMVKSFDAALSALNKGETSAPVQTSFGWHIIRVDDVDPGTLAPFELIEPRVVEAMQRQATDALKHSLVAERSVSINRAALTRLLQ